RSLLMSSSHTATPAADSWPSGSACPDVMDDSSSASLAGPPVLARPGQARLSGLHRPLGGEPELGVQGLVISGFPVVLGADALTSVAHVTAPAERDACLDADPGADAAGQHLLPVRSVLLSEPFQARHRHHPR